MGTLYDKNNSEASQHLVAFNKMVEPQFKEHVKRIQTDNGFEFQSRYMMEFNKDKGILLETFVLIHHKKMMW